MAPVLGYWNIRGLAEPIRYLLSYLEVEFEDKRYNFGPEPNYLDSEWIKTDKKNLELELPNIPYYIDDEVKITQSMAILRHLARKHKLYFPTSGKEVIRFEMMEGHVRDLHYNLAMMAYNPLFEQYKDMMFDRVKGQLKDAADFLGDKDWLYGDKISHVDFIFFEGLDNLNMCFRGCYEPYENLVKFVARFTALPGVEKYRKTSPKWPLYSPFAIWGGKGDAPQ